MRLGVTLFQDNATCSACSAPMPPDGSHALHCTVSISGFYSRYWRHNELAKSIQAICSHARLNPRLNQAHLAPGYSADIYVPNFHRSNHYVCDVTVSNPLTTANATVIAQHDVNFFIQRSHDAKLNSPAGAAFTLLPSTIFQPLAFSAFGTAHPSAKIFLKLLTTHHSRASGYTYSNAARFVSDYIFCGLAKANASMLSARYHRATLLDVT